MVCWLIDTGNLVLGLCPVAFIKVRGVRGNQRQGHSYYTGLHGGLTELHREVQ